MVDVFYDIKNIFPFVHLSIYLFIYSDVRFLRLNFLGRTPEAGHRKLRAEIEGQRLEARVRMPKAGGQWLEVNRQLRAVMDSITLPLLYFDVILLDGSRAVALKGTMSRRTHGEF